MIANNKKNIFLNKLFSQGINKQVSAHFPNILISKKIGALLQLHFGTIKQWSAPVTGTPQENDI